MAIVQAHSGSTIRKKANDKRTVYKNVLDSPFILKWPVVNSELGSRIVDQLLSAITPVGDYRRACKKKPVSPQSPPATKPAIMARIHVGINQVTRYLEQRHLTGGNASYTPVVFVCKREIKPAYLCNHLLSMAASSGVKLVPLPRAEAQLSSALGLRRACALVVEIQETEEALRLSAQEVPDIRAPWLKLNPPVYQPTHVKVLQTTAPVKKPPNVAAMQS